jgi:hypothetical protein
MECDARNVASVTFECEDRGWVGGFNIVKLDCMVACRSEESFVGRNAQSIDL